MKITFSIKLKAHCDSQVLITEPFSFLNHVIGYFHVENPFSHIKITLGLYSRFHITPPSSLVSSDLLVRCFRLLNSELHDLEFVVQLKQVQNNFNKC
jgi:hypothetical protein